MANYHTEQKKLLLDFLQNNSGRSYTIEEICASLGGEVGKSTVYRLMNGLVEEKKVHKSAGEGRQFRYRITADEHCKHHLHLQCTDCGRVLHLDEATSDALLDSVLASGGFSVSEEDTVLMGRCAGCKVGKK
jgi:Fur family ferric uptake transcriptional regulator